MNLNYELFKVEERSKSLHAKLIFFFLFKDKTQIKI
jgi:hypothetical protein